MFSRINRSVWFSSCTKARITRTPDRFSRVAPVTPSRFSRTLFCSGMLPRMMPKTIRNSTRMTPAKIRALPESMVKAMISAPKTTKGERSSRRKPRLIPVCTWLISPVIRVISVEVPK